MTQNDLEDFTINKLVELQYTEEKIADIIVHLRNLNLPTILIDFLIAEDDFIWYLLNTYEFMLEHLRNKGIKLNTYYAVTPKHPKSNFWVRFCNYPPTLETNELRAYYWDALNNQYTNTLNSIT